VLSSLGVGKETLDSFLGGQVEAEIRRQKLAVETAGAGLVRRAATLAGAVPQVPLSGV
jgi:hypothetical protein